MSANIYQIVISFIIVDVLQANQTVSPSQQLTTKNESQTIHQETQITTARASTTAAGNPHAAYPNQTVNITQMFIDARIVPEMIRYAPTEICRVFYRNGEVHPGSIWNYTETVFPPLVTWQAERNSTYFLYFGCIQRYVPREPYWPLKVYIQDRTPDPGEMDSYQLWAVSNIPGNDITKGTNLIHYEGPGPTRGRLADERFVFLVYKQRVPRVDIGILKIYKPFGFWEIPDCDNITLIEKKYAIGKPVAGNFFRALSVE